jgi:hypothetical protein
MTIYEKNIAALEGVDDTLAQKISQITTNDNYEVFASGHFADANILDKKSDKFMYEKRPIDEIEATYIELMKEYKLYKIMYIYGIGNGHLINMLLQNIFHEIIYVFEPEIELLYIALNLTDISEAIASKRLVLVHTQGFDSVSYRRIVDGLAVVHLKAYDLRLNGDFYEQYIEDIKKVNQEILKVYRYYLISTGNDATDELLGLEHFVQNLPTMLKNPQLNNLVHKGKNTETAIIVATGPSLSKQLPLLKEIQEHVTILAADASLPVLEKAGIKPDIVTTIERTARTGEFYENTSVEFQKDIVFALTAIVAQELLDNIKEGQLQLSMRPTGWHYSYMGFEKYGYLGLGMSAANMSYELASSMEFKEIIIIGQDLAYGKDGRSHADNHIFSSTEIKQKASDEFVSAYGGDGEVRTTKVWKMFLNGYENAVQQNKEQGKKFETINATEGGARIKGTVEMPFATAVEKYVNKEYKKEKIVLDCPSEELYEVNMLQAVEKMEEAIEMGKEMKRRVTKLLKHLTKIIRKYKKYDIKDIHLYAKEKELKKVVDKIADSRDLYYKQEFRLFYESLISPLITHIEYDIAYWSLQKETTNKDKVHKEWKMITYHHEWAYRILVNIEAILKLLEPGLEEFKEIVEEF